MKKNQQGQSTIEFIFCFVFAVGLILLVFNTSLNYVTGYITHYATFMASRVFMVQDGNQNTWGAGNSITRAQQEAQTTFRRYQLSIFGINDSAMEFTNASRDENVSAGEYMMIGVYTRFERKMDIIGQITGQKKLELISESFLGREPTRGVCASRVCKAITGRDECSGDMDITLFDNGC